MGTLHIVSKSPFASSALADCLRVCGEATILLIEDGVNAAIADNKWIEPLKREGLTVYVLQADCEARGLSQRIDSEFTLTDYAGFVRLCCEHTPVISWY